MSITASEIRGKQPSGYFLDDWFSYYPPLRTFDDYVMIRLGRKEYGFRLRVTGESRLTARYKCSHLEAQRRFKMMLVTARLTS